MGAQNKRKIAPPGGLTRAETAEKGAARTFCRPAALFTDAVQSTPGRERERSLKRFLAGTAAALVGTALIGTERLHFVFALGGTAAVFDGRGGFIFV